MFRKLGTGICGALVVLITAGGAAAHPADQLKGKDKNGGKTEGAGAKTAEPVDDDAIKDKIKAKLLVDTKTSALKIDVESKNGVVTLSGKVGSSSERAEAVKVAKGVDGVKKVVDKLEVKGAGKNKGKG
jgi:osmotically-inducible protein OsmY